MKNYFSSVIIPKTGATPDKLAVAMLELIDQLRVTVNNIEIDNMSEKTLKYLTSCKIHAINAEQIEGNKLEGVKKGDLVVVVGQADGHLSRVTDIYICNSN